MLLDTEPAIVVARRSGTRPGNMASTVSIVPYQMMPGDEKVVADRLYALLSKPPKIENPPAPPAGQSVDVAGQWDVTSGFRARARRITRWCWNRRAAGWWARTRASSLPATSTARWPANTVRFQSSLPTEGTRVGFQFTGHGRRTAQMSGSVALGEYGEARWTAERHQYRGGGRRG